MNPHSFDFKAVLIGVSTQKAPVTVQRAAIAAVRWGESSITIYLWGGESAEVDNGDEVAAFKNWLAGRL